MLRLENYSTNSLLSLKISSLNLELNKTQKHSLGFINKRLKNFKIQWRPHIWLSDEWFSPDGIDGFAIPFTIAHPKLIQLEKRYLGFYEGSTTNHFLKLACHEVGHAIDNAYKLRTLKERQKLFGLSKQKYPKVYKPTKNSDAHIEFLGDFYAQSHPEEDWAETVGFFLFHGKLPKKYRNTLVEKKFNYVEQILRNLEQRTYKTNKDEVLNYKDDHRTIEEYLFEKKKMLKPEKHNYNYQKLNNIFKSQYPDIKANTFINESNKDLLRQFKQNDPYKMWVLNKFLKDLKDECKKENFNLRYSKDKSYKLLVSHIEKNLDNFVTQGRTKVFM